MPPEPASTARAGRASRFTARKRVPKYNSTFRGRARSSFSTPATDSGLAATDNLLPSTGVPDSSECSQDAGVLPASGAVSAVGETPCAATPFSEIQSEGSQKTLASNTGMAKPDTDSVSGNVGEELGNSFEPENLGVDQLRSEKIVSVEDVTASGSQDGSENSVNLPPVSQQIEEERSVLSLTRPESGVGRAAATGNGKRKVLRKIVSISKKVIKKRVPKRTSNNVLNSVHDANVVEKSDEVMEKANITGEGKQELKHFNNTNVLEPIVGEKGHDPIGVDSVEAEASGFQFGPSVPEQKVDERYDDQSGVHAMDANIHRNEVETVMNTKEIENSSVENQSNVSVAEARSMEIVGNDDGMLIGCRNASPEGENDEVVIVEKNERKVEKPESGNGEMQSDIIGLSELLLSGEMEALERKKRRKTEVFVGGLDKGTNEDDIRKVFNEVGEILEVRLAMNAQTGKNKGFAFLRFATAADAKKALENYSRVEICGKQCGVVPVEGNDTIFLGNLDKNWKTEDVERLLETAGIEKIDKVTLKVDAKNIEKNRGFGFVEFETCKDAEIAFHKFQRKDGFGRNLRVKVEWAQPLVEPDEQEVLKVKSVYAEFLPSSWDEEKVKEYFKRFGEIEHVVLAKDLPASRRKDFAFIKYTTRDAAIACIEAINREKLEEGGSKVKLAVSLAKPIPKSKQMKHTFDLNSKQHSKAKPKGSLTFKKLHEPRQKGKPASRSHHNVKVDHEPSTTDELVQILRQQASSNQIPPPPWTGPNVPEYDFPLSGSKRPFSLIAHDPPYVEPRVPPRMHRERPYPISGTSTSSYDVGLSSFPYHQERPGFTSESVSGRRFYPDNFQETERATYYGNNNMYRRY